MSLKEFALALGGPRAQQVADQRRSNRTMEALGRYLGQGDESARADVYANNPDAGFQAEGLMQDRQTKLQQSVGNMAEYLEGVDPQYRPQAYAQLVPLLKRAFPGVPVSDVYGPEVEAALPQIRMLAAGAGGKNGQQPLTPSFNALEYARKNNLISDEEYRTGAKVALDLAPGASAPGLSYVEEYDPATGRTLRRPVLTRGLDYTGNAPSLGSGERSPAPQAQPQRTYTFGAPAPGAENDPAANLPPEEQQLAGRLMEAGMTFTVQNGRVVPSGMAPRESAPQPVSQPVSAGAAPTLDQVPINSYGGGAIIGGPSNAEQAEQKRREAAASAQGSIEGQRAAGPDFADESSLRKEYTNAIAQPKIVVQAYEKVKNAATSGTAAGDMSMIFAYMKMLDPGSTVREGEYASARDTTGIPGQVLNLYNKSVDGQFLSPDQRQAFVQQAEQIATTAQQEISEAEAYYTDLAPQYNIDPARIVRGSGQSGQASEGSYAVGDVIEAGGKRWRVVGGDPNDPDVEEVL